MSNFYCAAPWRGLHINPRGDVKTCCAGDPNMLGNLHDQTIEQVLHGPVMQEIRATLRQGRAHDTYCKNCVQAEQYGRSERAWHNQANPGFQVDLHSDLDHSPVLIDIRWNTTCNLSCNYCCEKSSSKWATIKKLPIKSGTRPYYQQVCAYLENNQSAIKKLGLVGGEPLLLKENELLLDVVPDTCKIDLITNLSVDLNKNKIFAKLASKKNVGWNVSFENTAQRFVYVRHGASWTMMQTNMKKILACDGHKVGVHALYNIYSATRLREFMDWVKQEQVAVEWQRLFHPAYLDPFRISAAVSELCLVELDSVLSRTDLCANEKNFFQQVRNTNANGGAHDMLTAFQDHVQQIEVHDHPDQKGKFAELWPEISKII